MEAQLAFPIICPVLIGRAHDLAALRLLVEQTKSGQGQVALVSGEAGIGKSRLVSEIKTFAASHSQGFLLLQGSCFPTDRAIPYAPLLDLLRSFMIGPGQNLPSAESKQLILAFLPLLPDLSHTLPDVAAALPAPAPDPEQEKRHRFEVLAHFVMMQATKQPILLIVEDLHWSDDTSLEFLHYLARRCCFAHPLLILLTYRSDEVRPGLRHFLAQLERERLAHESLLIQLTKDEVDAMLRAIFALPRSVRLELSDPIYALTEGNPFFVEETLKSLIAAEEIYHAGGRWHRKELHELRIPRSVQDAVQQRTDQLSESARQVLTLAAVAGRRFDFTLLQQLTHYGEQQLLLLMKELIAAQLVVEESAEQFAFRHALTRQAVYAELLVRERKTLHRTIADTMENLYSAAPDMHVAELAYHFYEAGDWHKALLYAQRAGEQARAMYAPRSAVEQLTRALDAARRGSIRPLATLYRLRGQAYETLGDFEHALQDYETTQRVAHEAGDLHSEWQALMDLGFLWSQRDYRRTGSYFQQALELARPMNDPLALAQTLNRLGNWHLNIEEPGEALHYHREALALIEQAHDQHGLAETYDLLAMTSLIGGDLVQATSYYRQTLALFQQLDDRQGLASTLAQLNALGGIQQCETMIPAAIGFSESLQMGEQSLKIAREIGQQSAEAYALLAQAQYLGTRGEYMRALEAAQAGLAIAGQIEHVQWISYAHYVVGVHYLDLLALSEAQQHLERALTLAREIKSWHWIRLVSGFLASVSILQPDFACAEAILNAALPSDAPSQTIGQRLVWAARADLALARGDPVQALDITERLIASAANLSNERIIPRLWKLRGEALAALHREVEAETALIAAQDAARAEGLRPWLWRICIALGRLYQKQARREEAEQSFATARALIEELAANVPGEELRSHFLSQATTPLPQKRPLTPGKAAKEAFGGLTAREREVAALIAGGKSNREIAGVLVVSERTIETHVANIMFKLNVQSRRQIRDWALEKGLSSH